MAKTLMGLFIFYDYIDLVVVSAFSTPLARFDSFHILH